jgi:hypothetical protein
MTISPLCRVVAQKGPAPAIPDILELAEPLRWRSLVSDVLRSLTCESEREP